MIAILILMVILAAAIWYATKCIKLVSKVMVDGILVPTEAIITAWGKPVRAVGQGLYWLWWPKYKIGLCVPTVRRKLDIEGFEVHTKKKTREGRERTKPVTVEVTVHLAPPRSMEVYKIRPDKLPSAWEDCIFGHLTKENSELVSVRGDCLLINHLYRALAPDKMLDTNLMAAFFKKAIIDGVRAIMVRYSYTECREKKTLIEKEIKDYFLTDPANLFVGCGFPPVNLDISITSMSSTEEIEHSLYAEEVASIEGRASMKEMEALSRAGVDENIAAILTKGVAEKGGGAIDLRPLLYVGAYSALTGINPSQKPSLPSSDLVNRIEAALREISPEKVAIIKETLREAGINL